MAQDPSPGSRAGAVKTNTLPLFKQSPDEPFPGRNPTQVPRPAGVTLATPRDWWRTAARTKLVITSAFLVSGSGEFSRANTSGSHFEEERRVSEASVFQALQKRSARHTHAPSYLQLLVLISCRTWMNKRSGSRLHQSRSYWLLCMKLQIFGWNSNFPPPPPN